MILSDTAESMTIIGPWIANEYVRQTKKTKNIADGRFRVSIVSFILYEAKKKLLVLCNEPSWNRRPTLATLRPIAHQLQDSVFFNTKRRWRLVGSGRHRRRTSSSSSNEESRHNCDGTREREREQFNQCNNSSHNATTTMKEERCAHGSMRHKMAGAQNFRLGCRQI